MTAEAREEDPQVPADRSRGSSGSDTRFLVFDCPDRRGALIPAKPPKNQSRHVKLPGGRQAKNKNQVSHREATVRSTKEIVTRSLDRRDWVSRIVRIHSPAVLFDPVGLITIVCEREGFQASTFKSIHRWPVRPARIQGPRSFRTLR